MKKDKEKVSRDLGSIIQIVPVYLISF